MKKALIIFVIIFLGSCATNPPQQSMVLEGWIDADGFPIVLIHKSYVIEDIHTPEMSLEDIAEDLLIPFGKVVVSDGEQEVILTGRMDTAYMPFYTYSSLNMRGEVGKHYTVTAKYKDLFATATTTIPPKATIDSLRITFEQNDLASVWAYMSVDDPSEAYFAFFMREYGTKQFLLCPFDVFDAKNAVDNKMVMKIYNPMAGADLIQEGLNFHFRRDTSILSPKEYQIKVARIDYESYQFWKAYNEQVITSGIFFVPIYTNMPSNVIGGIGIFSGMGCSVYKFNLAKDTIYRFK